MTYLQLQKTLLIEKQIVFKHWTGIQLYDVTNFHGYLKIAVNNKSGHFSGSSSRFQKILFGKLKMIM